MLIERLLITNFRNLSALELKPCEGFNLITGPNGSGKTSVLEAVSYLAQARSFRGSSYQYLIKSGTPQFSLYASVMPDTEPQIPVDIGISRGRLNSSYVIKVNGAVISRLSDLASYTCVQVIHPQGIELITGGPEERRHFVDWGVFYTVPHFSRLYSDYMRALKQRNGLIRLDAPDSEFAVWDAQLAKLSLEITQLRRKYVADLKAVLEPIVADFLPQFTFDFNLSAGFDEGADLSAQMAQNLEKERVLGYTSIGCHRADLKVKSNSISAGATLSRGQLKLLVCAMRMSQSLLLKQQTERSCIFLIDDLNAELDKRSQHLLLTHLARCRNQVFITNITPELQLPADSNKICIELEDGRIVSS